MKQQHICTGQTKYYPEIKQSWWDDQPWEYNMTPPKIILQNINIRQDPLIKYLLEEKVRDYFDLVDEYFLQNYIANFDSTLFESNFKCLELTLRKNSLLTSSNKVIYIPFKYRNKKILINI